jgi:hypothetical protein
MNDRGARAVAVIDFLHGCGEIELKEALASTRLVKEALKRKLWIRVVEESQKHVKCKVIRFARLYAFPFVFLNPTLDLSWRSRGESRTIKYSVISYDYHLVAFGSLVFGIGWGALQKTLWDSLKMGLFSAAMALLFFGGLVLADTKYFTHRVRTTMLNLTV